MTNLVITGLVLVILRFNVLQSSAGLCCGGVGHVDAQSRTEQSLGRRAALIYITSEVF